MAGQFVLVPGAWLGGWCWKYLTPLLLQEGHEVCTPTLTGLGERKHLSHCEIGIETHIMDIVNTLEYNDFTDVVLLGHSYAGLVVTGVAERVPERLSHVVYLDALVPLNDDPVSASDFYPTDEWETMEEAAKDHAGGWPLPDDPPGWVGISDEDTKWMREKAVPHPLHTFRQQLNVGNPEVSLPTSYILCTQNGMDDATLEMIRELCEHREWQLRELDTGHWPMVSTPRKLAHQLSEVL